MLSVLRPTFPVPLPLLIKLTDNPLLPELVELPRVVLTEDFDPLSTEILLPEDLPINKSLFERTPLTKSLVEDLESPSKEYTTPLTLLLKSILSLPVGKLLYMVFDKVS